MADQPTHNLPPRPVAANAPSNAAAGAASNAADRRSLGRRSVAVARRWARDTFNREQLLSSLRALAWVAPLSLLIWIYAEREQQLLGTARFPIVLKSADPDQVATLVSAADQNVTATLKGPKARLDKVKDMLDPQSGGGPVVVVIDGNRTPNQYEIDVQAQIQKDFRLESNGITVEEVQPRHVRVEVDALEEVELAVKADPQARFPAPPTFDPPTVRLKAPAAALRAAKGEVYAKANLPPLPPGPHSLKAVPVTVEGLDPKLVARPSTVSATVEVGQADELHEIASVPVIPMVVAEQQAFKKHTLRHDLFLPNVTVYGPPEKIRQLKAGTLNPRPLASFKVFDQDLGKQRVTRELQYELPEGVRLGETAPRSIAFDLLPDEAT